MIQDAIRALVDGPALDAPAAAALEEIMTGKATPAQIGAFLAAHARPRRNPRDHRGSAGRHRSRHAEPCPVPDVIDICGTGGDGIDTINVSTAAGFVVAGAGVRVAKHGNRAASSKCGSADVLEALGARIDLGGAASRARHRRLAGSASSSRSASTRPCATLAGPRREIGVRTMFNILGPLSNPAAPRRQLVGVGVARVWARSWPRPSPSADAERAMVVHSDDGMDEISPAAANCQAWVAAGRRRHGRRPYAGRLRASPAHPVRGRGRRCAEERRARSSPSSMAQAGPKSDFVVMNAAAALFVAGPGQRLPRRRRPGRANPSPRGAHARCWTTTSPSRQEVGRWLSRPSSTRSWPAASRMSREAKSALPSRALEARVRRSPSTIGFSARLRR